LLSGAPQLQDCRCVPPPHQDPPYYDPYDAEIDADPYPAWKRLRDEAPLYYNERYDFYALTRFDDVLQASLEWQTYSSARGTVLEMIDTEAPDAESAMAEAGLGMMIFLDPPDHDDLRRIVSRSFTPRKVRTLEARARKLCAEFLDPEREGTGFDYVEVLAAKVPTMVIGALLGVPESDQDMLRKWIDAMMRLDDGDPQIAREKVEAVNSIGPYIEQLVEERRRAPRDDLLSELLAADLERADGSRRKLDHREVTAFFNLLEFAGSETTARLLGWMAVLLARHPEQRAKLVTHPDLIPNAVEELLRYEPPSPIQARFVTRDVEWHGQTVPARSKIALLTGAAGRDERQYTDPDTFDVTRTFDRHVSLGFGVHYCLGAHLARLEARVAIEETLARFPEWEVDEREVELVHTSTVRGPVHVPVRL
jgi:cytochrome P450